MEGNPHKPKRTLRDVSHHFFSSLEESKQEKKNDTIISSDFPPTAPHGTPVENVIEKERYHHKTVPDGSISAHQVSAYSHTGFNPSVKMLGIIPLRQIPCSLLLHVYFAKLFLHSPYKVYIISTNPQSDSWDQLQRSLNLPALVDIDFSKGIRTFTLFKDIELLVTAPESFQDLFSLKDAHITPPHIFDSESAPALFLLDCFNVDFYLKEHIASLLDSFIILSSCHIDDFRNAYKMIKAYAPLCPQALFTYVLFGREDAPLKEMASKEYNQIVARFLNMSVHFIGFCEFDLFARGNNIRWTGEEKEQVFKIDIDFVDSLKKENWTEELLSLYQTVMSNVKL